MTNPYVEQLAADLEASTDAFDWDAVSTAIPWAIMRVGAVLVRSINYGLEGIEMQLREGRKERNKKNVSSN